MTDASVAPNGSGLPADTAPSKKYSLSPTALLELIAGAYHEAALSGMNMRSATEVLEAVRTSLAEEFDYIKAWDQLDNYIGRTLDKRLRQVVANVRDKFVREVSKGEVARLNQSLSENHERGFDEWLRTHAEALANWRMLLAKTLCEAPLPFPASVVPIVEKIGRATNLVIEERWPESFAMFRYLSQQEAIPRAHRAQLLVVAAEIEIYQLRRLAFGKKLLDEAQELAPNEARVFLGQGEYCLQTRQFEEAARYFQKVIERMPQSAYGYVLMGDLYEEQREFERSEESYQNAMRVAPGETASYARLLRMYGNPERLTTYETRLLPLVETASVIDPLAEYIMLLDLGNAYQQSGRNDEAHSWYDKAVQLNPNRQGAYLSKGYAYLEQQMFEDARAMFAKAIEMAPESTDGYWGLYFMHDQRQEWREAIDAYELSLLRSPVLTGRIHHLLDDQSAPATFDELKNFLFETLRSNPEDESTLNTLTTLADLYKKDGRVADALHVYQKIREAKGADYEADYQNLVGNTKYSLKDYEGAVAAYTAAINANPGDTIFRTNLSLAYQGLKQWDQARAALNAVKEAKGEENYATYADKMAEVWNTEGNDYFSQAKYDEAIERYSQAIDFDDKEAVYFSNMALAWERLWPIKREMEALQNAKAALERAAVLSPDNQEYQNRLGAVDGQLRMAQIYGPQIAGKTPTVTPLAIEMASDLVPFVANAAGELLEEVQTLTEALRQRIADSFGVRASGIRFRGNEGDLPPGSYIIMLMEIPIVMGTIDINKRLFTGNETELTNLGIPFEPAMNPLTGEKAFWVEEKHCETIKAAGLTTWALMEYPIRHLEAVVTNNLSEFIDHQEANNLLDGEAATQLKDLTAFTSVLKGLVAEKAPIVAFPQILKKLNESLAEGKDLTTIIEEVRSLPEVRPSLWGNSYAYAFHRLGDQITKDIAKSVRIEQGNKFLAMLPEDCQEALARVRESLSSVTNVALVVEQPELRPLIRRLIELEWPHVPVLSRAELLPELSNRIVGEI